MTSELRHLICRINDMPATKSQPTYLQIAFCTSQEATFVSYRTADKSLARCILFDDENISFDGSLVMYINSTNIPAIMIINRIYEHQNLLSL
jgi:hypothetical protein